PAVHSCFSISAPDVGVAFRETLAGRCEHLSVVDQPCRIASAVVCLVFCEKGQLPRGANNSNRDRRAGGRGAKQMSRLTWIIVTIICAGVAFGAVQNDKPAELPEGEGKKILETTCAACHGMDKIVNTEGLSKEDWRKVIDDMTRLGAALNGDQPSVLADYLAA